MPLTRIESVTEAVEAMLGGNQDLPTGTAVQAHIENARAAISARRGLRGLRRVSSADNRVYFSRIGNEVWGYVGNGQKSRHLPWRTKSGEEILIKDMSDNHLARVARMIRDREWTYRVHMFKPIMTELRARGIEGAVYLDDNGYCEWMADTIASQLSVVTEPERLTEPLKETEQ